MIELLRTRRSIRKFKSDKVSQEHLALLEEALLRSPSSRGINPWEFIFVDDPAKLAALSVAKTHGAGFLKGAAVAVVVCADTSKSDVCIEDCSIAAIILQLTALSLGLGSCWAQMRNRKNASGECSEELIKNLFSLPESFTVVAVIGIGHPDETKVPLSKEALQYGKIHR